MGHNRFFGGGGRSDSAHSAGLVAPPELLSLSSLHLAFHIQEI